MGNLFRWSALGFVMLAGGGCVVSYQDADKAKGVETVNCNCNERVILAVSVTDQGNTRNDVGVCPIGTEGEHTRCGELIELERKSMLPNVYFLEFLDPKTKVKGGRFRLTWDGTAPEIYKSNRKIPIDGFDCTLQPGFGRQHEVEMLIEKLGSDTMPEKIRLDFVDECELQGGQQHGGFSHAER